MLSSRYLHLHEALGLGPMWLKQGAKVLSAAPAASAPKAATQPAQPAVACWQAWLQLSGWALITARSPVSTGRAQALPVNTAPWPP